MFSTKLMDNLARLIDQVVSEGEGGWQEKAAALRSELDEREAKVDEFLSWLNHAYGTE